jgi:hypothetical protein
MRGVRFYVAARTPATRVAFGSHKHSKRQWLIKDAKKRLDEEMDRYGITDP